MHLLLNYAKQATRIAGFALFVLLAACQARRENTSERMTDTLRVVTSFRVQSLEPARPASYFLTEFALAELPLMLSAEGKLIPHLLESYARIDERNWRLAYVVRRSSAMRFGARRRSG